MKFDVRNRYTEKVQFTADIECEESAGYSVKLGLAVQWGRGHDANLSGADLGGAYLSGADLRGAHLSVDNLSGADLSGADLRGADLRGAYLRGADLRGADLRGADLRGAYLRDANLIGADLIGADLIGAYLRGAYLSGAYIDKASDIQLKGATPIIAIGPIGSEEGNLFAYKTNKGVYLRRGCFFGTLREFRLAVKDRHGDNTHGVLYRMACDFIEHVTTK